MLGYYSGNIKMPTSTSFSKIWSCCMFFYKHNAKKCIQLEVKGIFKYRLNMIVRSSLFYNTSARHECQTRATRVQHECKTNDMSSTRVQHEGHKCDTSVTWTTRVRHERYPNDTSVTLEKNFDFVNDTSENIFSHPYTSYMANEKLQGETQFHYKNYLWKFLVPMPTCIYKVHHKSWTL